MRSLRRKLQIRKPYQKLRRMQCSRVLDLPCLWQKINNASQQLMQLQPIVQTNCLLSCNTFCNWWRFYANGQKPASYIQLQRRWNANQRFENRIKNPRAATFLKMFSQEGPKKLGEFYEEMYTNFKSCFILQKACERHATRKVKPVVKKIQIPEIKSHSVKFPNFELPSQPKYIKYEAPTTNIPSPQKKYKNPVVKKKPEEQLEKQLKELKKLKSLEKQEKEKKKGTSKKLEDKPDKKINRNSQGSRVVRQSQILGNKHADKFIQAAFDTESSLDSLDYKLSKIGITKFEPKKRHELPKEPTTPLNVASSSYLRRKPKRGVNVGRYTYRNGYFKPPRAIKLSLPSRNNSRNHKKQKSSRSQYSISDEYVSNQSKSGFVSRQVRRLYSKPSWIGKSSSSNSIYTKPPQRQSTNFESISNTVETQKSTVIKKKKRHLHRKFKCKSSLRFRQLAIEKSRTFTPNKIMRSPRRGSSTSTMESVRRKSVETTKIPPKNNERVSYMTEATKDVVSFTAKGSNTKHPSYESLEKSTSSEHQELFRTSNVQFDVVKHLNRFLEKRGFKYNTPYNGPKHWPLPFESNFLRQWRRDRSPAKSKTEKNLNVQLNNIKKRRKRRAKKKPQQEYEKCAICVNIYRREPEKPYMIAMRNHMQREELINYYRCKLIPKVSTKMNVLRNQPRIISLADQAERWQSTDSAREKLVLCYEMLCNCQNIVDNKLREHQCTERCVY